MRTFINRPRKGISGEQVRSLWKIAVQAVIFSWGLAFCTPNQVFLAAEAPVTMEAAYGYGNTAKGGRYLPLQVEIQNNQDTPLEATLQIKSRESDGMIYQYNYQVEIDAGSGQTGQYYIPLGTKADQLYMTLTDETDTVLLSERLRLNISLDVPELFVGILSDEPSDLKYLNGVGIHYSALRTRTFALKGEAIPEDEIGLDLLDVIVVNGYKLRNLSEKQTAAIMDWVHNGGVLLLGTGERIDDTLGRFAPELLDDSYGTAELRSIDMGESLELDDPESGILEISCVDIPLHGGNVLLSSGGSALLTAVAKEQGLIGVAAFDLADIAEFCIRQPSYVDRFFTAFLGEDRINQLAQLVYSGNSNQYWAVQSLINTGNVNKLPNLSLYVAIVLFYLVMLGPGLYLFLKKREAQIYYRRGVMVLSLVFAVIIYLVGTRTRFKSTFYTYAAIQDVTDDYVTDATYVNIRNPYNRPYTVDLDPSYSVLPITKSNITERPVNGTEITEEDDYRISISEKEDRTTIQGQNIVSFAPQYFRLERKSDNTERVGITGEVDYFEGDLSGSITNQFPFPLENTCLILYGNMVVLDRLEPGETKKLDDLQMLRFPLNNFYAVAERITGKDGSLKADIDDSEYLLALERTNMLVFYLDAYMSGYSADARVIAFSTEKEESQFLKSPSPETYGLTMLTSSIAVNASKDRSLYRSVLMKTPKTVSGSYDPQTNSMTGSEPVTLEYYLGNDIQVESLTFEHLSEEFLKDSSYIEAFSGSIYFYNYNSGNFDLMELNGQTLGIAALRPYLSSDNAMTVRYAYDRNGTYNSVQLPMPMVAGREH